MGKKDLENHGSRKWNWRDVEHIMTLDLMMFGRVDLLLGKQIDSREDGYSTEAGWLRPRQWILRDRRS